jgi:hypothetical protein
MAMRSSIALHPWDSINAPASAMACNAWLKVSGLEAWPAVSSSCATECSGRWAASCTSLEARGLSSDDSGEGRASKASNASTSVAVVTPSSAIRQLSSGLRSWRSSSLRCSAVETGMSRAHSLMPEMSKMSREAMMLLVCAASRMVASACWLAVAKWAVDTGAVIGLSVDARWPQGFRLLPTKPEGLAMGHARSVATPTTCWQEGTSAIPGSNARDGGYSALQTGEHLADNA